MAIDDDVLVHMPPEPFETISRRVRDGDLLLCAGNDAFSRLIGWATKSPWTHVAVVYRWPSLGRIMAFEAVQQLGVRAVPLQSFIRQSSTGKKPYPGKIILARHEDFHTSRGAHGSDAERRFADFAIDRFGDPFAAGEIFRIALRITLGRLKREMPRFMAPRDEFICSEYVAKCFERIAIKVPWDGLGFIAPADFANDPKIKAIGRFRTD